jgi:hypothetical protein
MGVGFNCGWPPVVRVTVVGWSSGELAGGIFFLKSES